MVTVPYNTTNFRQSFVMAVIRIQFMRPCLITMATVWTYKQEQSVHMRTSIATIYR